MGLGYRIIFSGTTSIHYAGVMNIIAATAVTIHLSFGLNENENQQDIIDNSVAQKSNDSQHGKSHVGSKALPPPSYITEVGLLC